MSDELGIVGTGAFARALAAVIGGRGRKVLLLGDEPAVERLAPRGLPVTSSPRELADRARLVILAVRSTRLRAQVDLLGDSLHGGHLVVHASGALLDGEGRVSRLIQQATAVKRIGALAGPALARDLAEGRPAALVVASAYDEVMEVAHAALAVPPTLRVYRRRDLVGVELAAALSGAMTIAVGVADAVGFGVGPRALLVTRAVAEMARFGTAAGAGEGAFTGLAGLGNLLVRADASSERSEDYRLGRALVKGGDQRPTEGAQAALIAEGMARQLGVRTPILDAVVGLAWRGATPKEVMARLADSESPEE